MRIALAQRMQVLTVPSVVNLVGVHGRPTPIPDEEIAALCDCLDRRLGLEPHPYLVAGRRVRITRGPLADMEGILARRKGQFRLVLSINLIARSVAVEVDENDVIPMKPTLTTSSHEHSVLRTCSPSVATGILN